MIVAKRWGLYFFCTFVSSIASGPDVGPRSDLWKKEWGEVNVNTNWRTLEHLSFSAAPQSNVAVPWTFLLQPIGGNERFLSPALLSFRSDGNDRSFRSMLCLEWNQRSNSVIYTSVPINLDRIFIWGFYDERLHIPSHLPCAIHSWGNVYLQSLKKKKFQENLQHIAIIQCKQPPFSLLLASYTDPHAVSLWDVYTMDTVL